MSIARGLERRLERLFEGVSKRVFGGLVHPAELAERVAREADLARFQHPAGPATANHYVLTLNPKDVEGRATSLERDLEKALADYAAEVGLRLPGPPSVSIETSTAVSPGQSACSHRVVPGPIEPWARLVGPETHPIGPNRVILGRSPDADVILPYEEASRHHALIHRAHGEAWIRDLGSANGTRVDEDAIGDDDVRLEHGAMVTLAENPYRFLEI